MKAKEGKEERKTGERKREIKKKKYKEGNAAS